MQNPRSNITANHIDEDGGEDHSQSSPNGQPADLSTQINRMNSYATELRNTMNEKFTEFQGMIETLRKSFLQQNIQEARLRSEAELRYYGLLFADLGVSDEDQSPTESSVATMTSPQYRFASKPPESSPRIRTPPQPLSQSLHHHPFRSFSSESSPHSSAPPQCQISSHMTCEGLQTQVGSESISQHIQNANSLSLNIWAQQCTSSASTGIDKPVVGIGGIGCENSSAYIEAHIQAHSGQDLDFLAEASNMICVDLQQYDDHSWEVADAASPVYSHDQNVVEGALAEEQNLQNLSAFNNNLHQQSPPFTLRQLRPRPPPSQEAINSAVPVPGSHLRAETTLHLDDTAVDNSRNVPLDKTDEEARREREQIDVNSTGQEESDRERQEHLEHGRELNRQQGEEGEIVEQQEDDMHFTEEHHQDIDTNQPRELYLMPRTAKDEAQIKVMREVFQNAGPEVPKGVCWERVSERLSKLGFHRKPISCTAKWSLILGEVCRKRGYTWVDEVSHSRPRKRKQDLDDAVRGEQATTVEITTRQKRQKPHSESHEDREISTDTPALEPAATPCVTFDRKVFRTYLSWSGASHDVMEVAWSPIGSHFIAGAAVNKDTDHTASANLVFGSLEDNSLTLLPGHHSIQTESSVPNLIYHTITAVNFSHDGNRMYSSSYDKTVRIWDIQDNAPRYVDALPHQDEVIVMDVSVSYNLLAAETNARTEPVRVYQYFGPGEALLWEPLTRQSNFRYAPNCLRFGRSAANNDWLVIGFGDENKNGYPSHEGAMTVCKFSESTLHSSPLRRSETQVFSCAWFPHRTEFLSGNVSDPNKRLTTGERSTIHIFSADQLRPIKSFSCDALDINDVTICESNTFLVSASCTDGSVRIWDTRNTSNLMHKFSHSTTLGRYKSTRERERFDVGIRMTDWTDPSGHIYTGGSDGVVRCWDPKLATPDAQLATVFSCESEITAGAFSPDRLSLLIGDAANGLHLLRTTCTATNESSFGAFRFKEAS